MKFESPISDIMLDMKPNHLAALLSISGSTLRLWAGKEYAEFLSPNAVGINGAHRSFSDQDARILGLVAERKARNASADDITAELRSLRSNDWRDLPPLQGLAGDDPVALVPREALAEYVRALRERYESQLQTAQQQAADLKDRLDKAESKNEVWEQKYSDVTDQLIKLNDRLTGLLEKEQKRRK